MGEGLGVLRRHAGLSEAGVELHALGGRQPPIRHVVDERVMEAESPWHATQVQAVGEPVERRSDIRSVPARQQNRVIDGERLADHGHALQELAIVLRQFVETRADDALERYRQVSGVADAAGAGQLDDEQRVAFGALDPRRVRLARMPGESPGIALGERLQGDENAVVAEVPTRRRREFGACRRQDQQRQIRSARQPVEEADDLAFRPMKIIDPQDERAEAGQRR
jgi:hypothetical protein